MLTGTRLTAYPAQMVTRAEWLRANPNAWVLSIDTGYDRGYGLNPYPGCDDPDGSPFDFDGPADPRLPPMTRVVGLGADSDPVAITLDTLTTRHVLQLRVAGTDAVVWVVRGLRSPRDDTHPTAGRAVAATAFASDWHGRTLHFRAAGGDFVDAETGSRWNVLGEAVSGPAWGAQLAPVPHLDAFWFAWAAFQPTTGILG